MTLFIRVRAVLALTTLGALVASLALTVVSLQVQAASVGGMSGIVTDTTEMVVPNANIYISCDDFAGEESKNGYFASANDQGEYSRSELNYYDFPCVDGDTVKLRAEHEHYVTSAPVTLGTIDFAGTNSETLQEWVETFFASNRIQNFTMEKLPPGWSGTVKNYDDEPIEGATFTLTCEGETRTLTSTTDADGAYTITQAQFTGAINSAFCYYAINDFDVIITISKDGYLSDRYTVSGVTGSDMGASSFNVAETRNFYLDVDPTLTYAEGDGSENNPFIIDTVERFEGIDAFPDYAEGLYFALGADIALGHDQQYIGNFSGVFDGRNHTITGNDRSLFGRLENNAVVKNLLIDTTIHYDHSESTIGILAGRMEGQSYVENVHTSGSIIVECNSSACDGAGGLVGVMSGTPRVYRSSSSADVLSEGGDVFSYGGLVGFMDGGSIEQSYATGDVRVVSGGGGLVGGMHGTPETTWIRDSYATGNVYARGQYYSTAGGFVGEPDGLIMRSYATGSVFASTTPAGGFVGEMNDEGVVIANSFSTATKVEGNGYVGGFIGAYYAGEIRNSAWLREIGKNAIGFVDEDYNECGLGGPLDLLMSSAPCEFGYDVGTFDEFTHKGYGGESAPIYRDGEDSWDFGNVWGFDENINDGLPYLLWGTEWEPGEEVTPPNNGGGSSGGSRGGGSRVSAVTTPAPSAALTAMVAQLRTLIAAYQAAGGTLSAGMAVFVGEAVLAEAPGTSVPTTGIRDLQVGSSGDDVRALQTLLIAQGHTIPAGVTGFFAGQTQSALVAWQTAHNIVPAMGYFGSITRAAMKAAGITGLWW